MQRTLLLGIVISLGLGLGCLALFQGWGERSQLSAATASDAGELAANDGENTDAPRVNPFRDLHDASVAAASGLTGTEERDRPWESAPESDDLMVDPSVQLVQQVASTPDYYTDVSADTDSVSDPFSAENAETETAPATVNEEVADPFSGVVPPDIESTVKDAAARAESQPPADEGTDVESDQVGEVTETLGAGIVRTAGDQTRDGYTMQRRRTRVARGTPRETTPPATLSESDSEFDITPIGDEPQSGPATEPGPQPFASQNSISGLTPLPSNATEGAALEPGLNGANGEEPWGEDESYQYPVAGTGVPGDKSLEGAQSPALTIHKLAPTEIQVGKEAEWQILVRNTGKTSVEKIEVMDLVPRGARLVSTAPVAATGPNGELTWSFETLRPGEEAAMRIQLVPLDEGEIGSVATVRFASSAGARSQVTRPELHVRLSSPKSIMLGEQITMSIEVSNTGTGRAEDVVLLKSIPEQFEHPAGRELELAVGTLKPGESVRKELVLKAVRPGISSNVLTALAGGDLEADDRVEIEVISPELELSVDGPGVRYLDTKTRFDIVLANPGSAPASDVRLMAKLSPGLKFVSANNAGRYDPRTHAVQWNLVELPAQRSGGVSLVVEPLEMGNELIRVEAAAQKGLSDLVEKPIQVEGIAALLFTVADVEDPIEVGGRTTYEVRLVNQGSKEAANLKLVAEFPPEMKPLAATGPVQYRISGQQIVFEPLGTLGAKADTTFKIQGEALEPGDLRIKILLEADELEAPVTKEESTRAYSLQ